MTISLETNETKRERNEKLRELVALFRDNLAVYKDAARYDEANTRVDFIDKFFEILGWDVRNVNGYSEQYRDVVREDRVYIDNRPKAPDYAFRVGNKTQFFVEAKRPSVNIRDAIAPAFQLRRYGRSAKLSLSLLTDFEEFAVYDTRITPHKDDKASVARIFYCTFEEYEKNFDYIYSTFSKDAVLRGSFDRYIEATKNKRGTSEVDDEILALVEDWRLTLAKNVAKLNPDLDEHHINLAVQRIVDRILFLRIAEGRSIEPYGMLLSATKTSGIYQQLHTIFAQADDRYNAGLFQHETWLENVVIDDKVLTPIIVGLYYPESQYEFAALPIEILGSVYERFLGKTIRLTAGHQAKLEEKPEVRKAGGVYYTPQYVVDYIVNEMVGRKIKDKTPSEIATLSILDPSCGSGSFLVGAYTFLLDWYLAFYSSVKELKNSLKRGLIYEVGVATYRLTIEEKQQILLRHIYGVDIDPLAVEVTNLSLYLKLLEHENESLHKRLFRHSDFRALPNLDANVKCGNSLIASDFYRDKDLALFGQREMRKINTFDWDKAFPQIFNNKNKSGGFDCVVGNPPYVRQETLTDDIKRYFQQRYAVYHGAADLYTYFIEKGIGLLKPNGEYGVIVSNKWLRANYGEPLRKWLKTQKLLEIADFGDLPVFGKVTSYPLILRTEKNTPETQLSQNSFAVARATMLKFTSLADHLEGKRQRIEQNSLDDAGWQLVGSGEKSLFDKLMRTGVPLGEYVAGKIYRGVLTGLNEAFVIDADTRRQLIKEDKKSAEIIKPFLAGRDIKRYAPLTPDKFLIFTRRGIDIDEYPAVKAHLEQFRKQLTPKPKNRTSKDGKAWQGRKPGAYKWYEIQDSIDYFQEFEETKIVFPDIALRMQATYDVGKAYSVNTSYIIPQDDKYLLALLNSEIVQFVFVNITSQIRGGYSRFIRQYVEKLPIYQIDENNKKEVAKRAKIISLVDQMLAAHSQQHAEISDTDRAFHNQRIAALDDQINRIVYELYGLTDEEVKIVEGR